MKATADMTVVIHDSDATFDLTGYRGYSCDRAQTWVKETGGLEYFADTKERRGGPKNILGSGVPTNAYVDLLFSFGMASLADAPSARELLQRAESVLNQETDEIRHWLLPAYRYRILRSTVGRTPADCHKVYWTIWTRCPSSVAMRLIGCAPSCVSSNRRWRAGPSTPSGDAASVLFIANL